MEKKTRTCNISGEDVNIVDLSGIYSFGTFSPDAQITRNYLLSEQVDAVVDILDVTSLERRLYPTMMLLELDVHVIVVAKMMDQERRTKSTNGLSSFQIIFGFFKDVNFTSYSATFQSCYNIDRITPNIKNISGTSNDYSY